MSHTKAGPLQTKATDQVILSILEFLPASDIFRVQWWLKRIDRFKERYTRLLYLAAFGECTKRDEVDYNMPNDATWQTRLKIRVGSVRKAVTNEPRMYEFGDDNVDFESMHRNTLVWVSRTYPYNCRMMNLETSVQDGGQTTFRRDASRIKDGFTTSDAAILIKSEPRVIEMIHVSERRRESFEHPFKKWFQAWMDHDTRDVFIQEREHVSVYAWKTWIFKKKVGIPIVPPSRGSVISRSDDGNSITDEIIDSSAKPVSLTLPSAVREVAATFARVVVSTFHDHIILIERRPFLKIIDVQIPGEMSRRTMTLCDTIFMQARNLETFVVTPFTTRLYTDAKTVMQNGELLCPGAVRSNDDDSEMIYDFRHVENDVHSPKRRKRQKYS
jgi:hypothetical protein